VGFTNLMLEVSTNCTDGYRVRVLGASGMQVLFPGRSGVRGSVFFLGDVKDQQTSKVFLSPIHVSCFDCDYVRLLRLGSSPKGQGYHVCLLYGQRLP
jgi:hypothetical protein